MISFWCTFHLFVCYSVTKLCPTLRPHELQHTRLPCPSLSPGVGADSCPLRWWCFLSHPLLPPSPFAFNLSLHQGLFQWVGSSHQAARVLELQLQHQSFQWIFRVDFLYDWLVWSPCSQMDSLESSSVPKFQNINPLVLSLIYGPALTSVHDYWKNHSLD